VENSNRESNDIFRDLPDNDQPVSRGEMRQIVRDIRSDLKWAVAIVLVGGRTLDHIQLPPTAGFIGGAVVVGVAIVKLAVARG